MVGVRTQNGNCATADYYNVCAIGSDVWIPDNWAGQRQLIQGMVMLDSYVSGLAMTGRNILRLSSRHRVLVAIIMILAFTSASLIITVA